MILQKMIVIDLGCARHGNSYSIERLIEELHPDELYGFDPFPGRADFWMPEKWEGTKVYLDHKAAWTYDGTVGFLEDGIESRLSEDQANEVSCFDLARFIEELVQQNLDTEIVLKMDVEGAEYALLTHLIAKGHVEDLLKFIWIEWHPLPDITDVSRRVDLERSLHCEIREWLW